jgi:hypothetical protein
MDFLDHNTTAAIAIGVAATSEILALTPLKSNSCLQLIMNVLLTIFPSRR